MSVNKDHRINAHKIFIDNVNDQANAHCLIESSGEIGENDIHFRKCNVQVEPNAAFQCDKIQSTDGTTMIDFDGTNHTIDFNGKTISNFNFSESVTTESITSKNVDSNGNFNQPTGGGTLEQELDAIYGRITDVDNNNVSVSQGSQISNRVATTTAGGNVTFTKPISDFVDLTTAQTLTNKTMDYNSNTFQNFPAGFSESDDHTFTGTNTFNGDLINTSEIRVEGDMLIDTTEDGRLRWERSQPFPQTGTVKTYLDITDHQNTGVGPFTLILPSIRVGATQDVLVGRETTDTLTNKTLTSPEISTITNGSATLTLPTSTGTVALTSDITGGISESDNLEFTGSFAINNGGAPSYYSELLFSAQSFTTGMGTQTSNALALRNHATTGGGYFQMLSGSSGTGLVIDDSNNVGIGTTSPQTPLDIKTNAGNNCVNLRNGSFPNDFTKSQLLFSWSGNPYNSSGYSHKIQSRHSSASQYGNNAIDFYLWQYTQGSGDIGNYHGMSITGSGVGIGTISPSYKLYVNGSLFYSSGGLNGSDDRIKHNEQPILNALETISKITPKHYIKTGTKIYDRNHNFELDANGKPLNASGNPLDKKEYTIESGIIAQELRDIPELKFVVHGKEFVEETVVTYRKDDSGEYVLDEDGKKIVESEEVQEKPNILGVDYNSIHCTHIAATKELHAMVLDQATQLEEKEQAIAAANQQIADLQSQLTTLQQQVQTLFTLYQQ